jgi:hypothetical protein
LEKLINHLRNVVHGIPNSLDFSNKVSKLQVDLDQIKVNEIKVNEIRIDEIKVDEIEDPIQAQERDRSQSSRIFQPTDE